MIILKVFVLAFIVVHAALAKSIRGRTRYANQAYSVDSLSVNHPPAPEFYEAIPVSVVYEDGSSRGDKSIKSGTETTNNFKPVDKDGGKSEPIVKTEIGDKNTSNLESIKVSAPKEVAIPVSVVYEDGSSRGDKLIKSGTETTNNFKPVDKDGGKSEPIVKTEIGDKNTSNLESIKVSPPKDVTIVSKKENKTEKIESTPSIHRNQEQQIPVAVIYELESSFIIDTSPTSVPTPKRMQTNRRNIQRPPMAEKKVVDKETLETRKTDHKDNQKVAKVDMQQQSVRVSENSQEGKEKQVVVKENHGNDRPGNGQTFPKRDNSTRQHEFVPIIQSENVVFSHSGNFMYSYEGGDGTKAFENGRLKTYEDDNAGEAVSGGFSYMGNDGNEYSLSYTADENGYRPVGAHLPTPPPIPPQIARALAYLATKTTPEPVTESLSDEDH